MGAKVIEVTACQTCPYLGEFNTCLHPEAPYHNDHLKSLPDEGIADFCCLQDKDDYLESEFNGDSDSDENPKDEKIMPPPFYYNNVAEDEGWCISYTGIQSEIFNLYRLEKYDDIGNFENDDEAITHVVVMAINQPKGIHAEALLYLARYSPNEISSRVRDAVGAETFAELKEVMRHTEFDNF